jgi:glucosamine 6-phosphate synthetase-like amidotransferase/phosphosugar isomerase protein
VLQEEEWTFALAALRAARMHAVGSPMSIDTIPVPKPGLALLTPLLSVVPGQVLAGALARAKGLDPDRPHGLTKVTLAL